MYWQIAISEIGGVRRDEKGTGWGFNSWLIFKSISYWCSGVVDVLVDSFRNWS